MPKPLFYTGTVVALLLACLSGFEAVREMGGGAVSFRGALLQQPMGASSVALLAVCGIAVALAISAIFVRMASLLAARNLFAAFLSLLAIAGTFSLLTSVLFLHVRAAVAPRGLSDGLVQLLAAGWLVAGVLASVTFLSLRPYFRIQASRLLANLVVLPLPLFALLVVQEADRGGSLRASTAGSFVFSAVIAVLFTAIGLHCIRHRHLFIEVTSLRELLDSRVDPRNTSGRHPRVNGDVAFDS
jgi:hypothetical protein